MRMQRDKLKMAKTSLITNLEEKETQSGEILDKT
jgi:hypothetical protein